MLHNILKDIQKIIEEFFKKTTFAVDYKVELTDENTVRLFLEMEEPQIFIGERGSTLLEIQRLLGSILCKQTGRSFLLDLDINNYKQKRADYLCNLAQTVADRVALIKIPEALFPMSAYERRVVHVELANRNDVATESEGEGEKRRVMIKPV